MPTLLEKEPEKFRECMEKARRHICNNPKNITILDQIMYESMMALTKERQERFDYLNRHPELISMRYV